MIFETWYDFKKVLESNFGKFIPNDLWLQVKPKNPLPWDESDLHTSLLLLSINKSGIGEFAVPLSQRYTHSLH